MAQAVGGTYGLPHGTMNAIVLPAALRFNAELAPEAVRRFGEAIGAPDDPAAKVEELAALSGPTRLRDVGVPGSRPAGASPKPPPRAPETARTRVRPRSRSSRTLYRSIW